VGRTIDEMIATLPAAQRRAVGARASDLHKEELTLRDLRKALQLTQKDVALRMRKGQDAVSRIEQRDDLLLSTLKAYVASMGGELEVICRFKGRPDVRVIAGTRDRHAAPAKAPRRQRARATSVA